MCASKSGCTTGGKGTWDELLWRRDDGWHGKDAPSNRTIGSVNLEGIEQLDGILSLAPNVRA